MPFAHAVGQITKAAYSWEKDDFIVAANDGITSGNNIDISGNLPIGLDRILFGHTPNGAGASIILRELRIEPHSRSISSLNQMVGV